MTAKRHRKNRPVRLHEAGWRFWLPCFLVLAGPSLHVSWGLFYDDVARVTPVTLGLVGAMFGAGLLSWAANLAIHVIMTRRKKSGRKVRTGASRRGEMA